ncbi:hypothetical protein E2L00_19295 [Cedecea colo]|uniref:Transposase n=1 Tax=Cedecea colo TaxID=2552946 RepID=A0ABX0VRE7_9ENTR|nr:hypothetical protein [Cedecea colo]
MTRLWERIKLAINVKGRISGLLRLLTKKEKAWFSLLCGQQPKINELIFLVHYLMTSSRPGRE